MLPDLIYVSDCDPGIARIKRGKGFGYLNPQGSPLRCEKEIARIKALAIPPAYRDVWICAFHNGHIQATGFDEANRKQYRYHAAWTEFRSEAKFEKLPEFGRKLPVLRRRVDKILKSAKRDGVFDKETAIAALVRLLDHTAMRIGGRSRSAQGATTLMSRNVRYDKSGLRLRYAAKGGKRVQSSVSDRRLQRIMEKIHGLPGKRVFQYVGSDGLIHPLDSGDVNSWLKQQSAMEDISAKLFRTWHGSVAALEVLRKAPKPTIKLACTAASEVLCNTPTIARKSYVHPKILDLPAGGNVAQTIADLPDFKLRGLSASERRLMALISES